jgi:hypothetical protein
MSSLPISFLEGNLSVSFGVVERRRASSIHFSLENLYRFEISGTKPSSGLGSAKSDCMLKSRVASDTAGLHVPVGGLFNGSKHIRPLASMFGWYGDGTDEKRQEGGSNGYREGI